MDPGTVSSQTGVKQSQQMVGSKDDKEEDKCCICMDTPSDPEVLKCKHVFCKDCIEGWFKQKPTCPSCGQVYGEMKGNQPPGTMEDRVLSSKLPGYEKFSTLEITYRFKSGVQGVSFLLD